MRHPWAWAVSVAIALVALAGCAGGSADAGSTETTVTPAESASLLFAVSGTATVADGVLTLQIGDGPVTFITDRPDRQAGRLDGAGLAAFWPDDGFASDPPNAILSTGRGATSVELRQARWDQSTTALTFPVEAIGSSVLPEGALGHVDLFIDDLRVQCGFQSPSDYPQMSSFLYAGLGAIDAPGAPPQPSCQQALDAFGALFGAWGSDEPFTQLQNTLGQTWTCSGGPIIALLEGPDGLVNPVPLPGTWSCQGYYGALVSITGAVPIPYLPGPPADVVADNQWVPVPISPTLP
jgi:hypothetical protein